MRRMVVCGKNNVTGLAHWVRWETGTTDVRELEREGIEALVKGYEIPMESWSVIYVKEDKWTAT